MWRVSRRLATIASVLIIAFLVVQHLRLAGTSWPTRSSSSPSVGADDAAATAPKEEASPEDSTSKPIVTSIETPASGVPSDEASTKADQFNRQNETASIDPTVPVPEKLIVVAKRSSENTSWVAEYLPDWENAIYDVDDQNAPLHTTVNKGRESLPYLTYIIDNYPNIPNIVVFLHAHKDGYPAAWHTDAPNYDNVQSLRTLQLDFVRRKGYVNLRCVWIPGCPDEIQPFRTPSQAHRTAEHASAKAWRAMFNESVPAQIGAACCGQFAVTRENILARPLSDYIRYRDWVLETELTDDVSGRIMEYLWHIIFGQPAVDCADHAKCQCDVYGRCDLKPSDP